MIRYALTHRSRYDYSAPAHHARHLLHLLPRSLGRQQVVMAALEMTPAADQRIEEQDYFGNSVISVECLAAHEFFETVLEAHILIEPWPQALAEAQAQNPITLMALRAQALSDPALIEFLQPTALTEADPALIRLGDETLMGTALPGASVMALMQRIYADFSYEQGVTTIATTAAAALARRAGVCQDYAHVMIASLRAGGVPARYVSGYLRSAADHLVPDDSRGAEQTHAWVSVWLGPALGWRDFDPTNNLIVDTDHVILAMGRDYADISPVRGVILGGGAHTPHVSVSLTRMDDDYMPPG
ncbi:MAG TPA: transglutaminase family protein [Acidiphilium sp.]|nr:MAG: hypothetical protein B7Z67_01860 [Acidiphilium sp. 21-60-14]OYV91415.1 MAG: hypothetical protein B7Z57_05150 [Acidiphilium sp. 37-60-79]OZB41408.1 MAG: hypothetical protein B7X48_01975 [Acidiphilium sp. 34-60-192]HQT87252.1 transglutaminase family protein [Acidiphilium sp.]HQU23179.1 transglutaminase family protein [Acidiphilium sp.]